ncbi:protein Dr1 isoform X2 [Hemibagrus wyckioides]|uniref:protein Dr1 isoform X2 n=1 Tax=Hemibagrus wyckioides TaxID=337641 RepID=UPI00266DAC27|nr:protein Dr1 isoform X2 [Hemibagrus wyckioides]
MASSSGNDDDLTIPRAAINKMIKETLPNVRVANDARELVVNCCTEFIHLVSSEANEICNKSEKKTISPEHVINGLRYRSHTSFTETDRHRDHASFAGTAKPLLLYWDGEVCQKAAMIPRCFTVSFLTRQPFIYMSFEGSVNHHVARLPTYTNDPLDEIE